MHLLPPLEEGMREERHICLKSQGEGVAETRFDSPSWNSTKLPGKSFSPWQTCYGTSKNKEEFYFCLLLLDALQQKVA